MSTKHTDDTVIDNVRGTPADMNTAIAVALGTYKGPVGEELISHIHARVRDYAAQKFQAAILRSDMRGDTGETERLGELFHLVFGDAQPALKPEIDMWVIYWNTLDYPGQYVARMRCSQGPTDRTVVGTIQELRERFDSQGLVNIGRFKQDDPCIVEVWI